MATESVILQFKTTGIPIANRQLTRMQTISSGLVASLSSVRTLLAGFVGIAGFTKLSTTLARFEQTMANVQAVSGATKREFEALEDVARQLGATTVFSAQQAGQGLVFLSQAGFSANESIKSLPNILQLAQAGGLGLAEASKITANVIRGMNLDVSEGARINDVFARAAARSNVTVSSLGQAFSFAAPFANALNVSIEEATSAIGKIGDAGITGGRAGRNLVAFFRQLVKVTPEAERILSKYSLTAEDIDVKTVGLSQVLKNLQPLIQNTGDTFRIFGARGALVANVLVSNNRAFDSLTGSLEDAQGSAREMARIMSSTLTGATKAFISAVTEASLQIGDAGLTKALTDVLKIATGVISEFNGMGDLFRENTQLTDEMNQTIQTITETLRFFGDRIKVVTDAFKEIVSLGMPTVLTGIATAVVSINVAGRGLAGTVALLKRSFIRFAPTLVFIGLIEVIQRSGDAINDFAKTDISPLRASLNGLHAIVARIGQAFTNIALASGNLAVAIKLLFTGSKQEALDAFNVFIEGSNLAKETAEDHLKTLQEIDQRSENQGELKRIQDTNLSLIKSFKETRSTFDSVNTSFKALQNPTKQQTELYNELTKSIEDGTKASERLKQINLELERGAGNIEVFRKLRDEARVLQTTIDTADENVKNLRRSLLNLDEVQNPIKAVSDEVKDLATSLSTGLTEGFREAVNEGTGLTGVLNGLRRSLNNLFDKILEEQLNRFFVSALGDLGFGSLIGSSGAGAGVSAGASALSSLSKINPVNNIDRSLAKTTNNYYNQGLQKTNQPQIQIYDQRRNTSAPIQTQRTVDNEGNLQLKIMIKDEVNSVIQEGGLDSSFDSRFGVKPLGT